MAKRRSGVKINTQLLVILFVFFLLFAWAVSPAFRDKVGNFLSTFIGEKEEKPETFPVYIKLRAVDDITGSTITSAEIYIYDAAGNRLEKLTVDSTTGIAQSQNEYRIGETIYVQARASGYYTTPLIPLTIPTDVPAEHTTVSLGNVALKKISTSITMVATDASSGNQLSSDSSVSKSGITSWIVSMLFTGLDSNSWYGCDDYTDMETGYTYKGGTIFVIAVNSTAITPEGYDYAGTIGTTRYFVYYLPSFKDSAYDDTDGTLGATITFTISATGTFNLNFYVYDALRVTAIQSLSFGTADASITNVTLTVS